MKVVINAKAGGFGLSEAAIRRYCEIKEIPISIRHGTALTGMTCWLTPPTATDEGVPFYPKDIDRTDPALVQIVEELGPRASGRFADLKIVEIPDDVQWKICEQDGDEWIAEVHRTWS